MMLNLRSGSLVLILVMIHSASPATSHDLHSIRHPSNTGSESAAAQSPINLNALDEQTRSVVVNASKWPVGRTLKVCFYGGDATLRQSIKSNAVKWLDDYVNLKMDFGDSAQLRDCSGSPGPNGRYEDIRIGFNAPGLWSYIGVDSHGVSGPSMNFEKWDIYPQPPIVLQWVVLHEFGHALGLHHEHQSPAAPCNDEFDTVKIKNAYGWSDAEIATNIAALKKNSSAYTFGPFNSVSIMMYSLRDDFFLKPDSPCKVPQNTNISDEDRQGLRRAYPKAPKAMEERTRGVDMVIARPDLPEDVRKRAALQKALQSEQ